MAENEEYESNNLSPTQQHKYKKEREKNKEFM
jgi:hypothetical protein